jgi:hypothetical protein
MVLCKCCPYPAWFWEFKYCTTSSGKKSSSFKLASASIVKDSRVTFSVMLGGQGDAWK